MLRPAEKLTELNLVRVPIDNAYSSTRGTDDAQKESYVMLQQSIQPNFRSFVSGSPML